MELAERVAGALGMELLELSPLGAGASGQVFQLETTVGVFALRVAQPHPGKRAGFGADVRVRRELLKLDERTSRPLAHAGTHPDIANTAWCLDGLVGGESPARGALPPRVCREIGEVLAHLHSLDAAGYGLLDLASESLRGCCDDFLEGVQSRLQDPWPFWDGKLEQHPLMKVAPRLASRLEALREEMLNVAAASAVVCHTDLHERQFLLQDGRLAALLDFSDAAIGPRVWDLASFGYFHGWTLAGEVLKGYGDLSEGTPRQARLFALVIALHHLSRSFTLNRPERRAFALSRLEMTLGALEGGDG